jgi:PAS domain S-box-containing protein
VGSSDSVRTVNRRFQRIRRWLFCLLCVLASFSAVSHVRGADSQRAMRVLMISMGSRFSIGFPIIEQNAVDSLRQLRPSDLEFYSESLDIIRFSSESYQRVFRNYVRDKYADDIPDLILLFYVGHLSVAEKLLSQLFPGTPVVAAGLTEEEFPANRVSGRVTGIAQHSDPAGTIELIRRLQPEIQRIVLIGGTADVDRDVMSRARQAAHSFAGRFEFEVWDKRSIPEILNAVRSLPPQAAIVFTRMFRDGAGRATISARAAQSIAKVSNVPVYVMSDAMMGTGAVGGSVSDIGSLGKRSGELAHRILGGAEPESIPLQIVTKGTPMFDWRALKRWGISERRLPPDSVVRFRPETFWDHYKWLVTSVLGVCIIEGALIYILLAERRRRRLAQHRLEERLRFEQLVSELSGTFINLAADKVEAQIVEALGRVASLLRFDIAALSVFTGPGPAGRVAHIWRAEGVPEISSSLTERDFPWVAQELFAGRDVSLRTLDGLPPQAHIDRATYDQYHVRSTHNVPMVTGGNVIGVLGLCTVWEEREMSRELLQGQRLLAEIFANALARKGAEESLRESEQNLRRLLETTAAVPWQADVQSWVFTYVGPQAVRLFGYPLEQWYEKDFWVSHLHPDDKEFAVNTCLALSKNAEDFEFEYRMVASSGKTVWVHDIVKCEHRDGKPFGLRGFMLDISERKQAEEALRESEERISLAANTAGLGLWVWDASRDESWVTPEGRRLFGWSESETITFERFIQTLHPDDRERTRQAVLWSIGSGNDYVAEYRVVLSGGAIRWIATRGRIESDGNGRPLRLRGVSLDITERKTADEALEKQRAFLRQVIDINPNFIFAKDREGRFTLVNQAVADAYGTTVDDLIGKTDADFNPNAEEVEFFQRMDLEVMDTLKEHFIPEEHLTDAQGEVRWLQTVKRPIIDKEDGSASQVLGASTDITQRKNAESELQCNRQELAHVTRISTMGELAASLAHELNQPLGAILSNAEAAEMFLAAEPPALDEVRSILADIRKDDQRASEVIQRMRSLLRKQELSPQAIDINEAVGEILKLLSIDASARKVAMNFERMLDLPRVWSDPVHLQQVVLNLVLNGMDVMAEIPEERRRLTVRTGHGDNGTVKVAVSDCGPGIPTERLAKLFEPFFTTKKDGMGMGLSIARTIVEAHHGQIWAENNPNVGATFYFTMPTDEGK